MEMGRGKPLLFHVDPEAEEPGAVGELLRDRGVPVGMRELRTTDFPG